MAILERETMGHLSASREHRDTAGGRELVRYLLLSLVVSR